MTENTLLEILKKLPFKITYYEFKEKQVPPYAVYYYNDEFLFTDNNIKITQRTYTVEAYFLNIDDNNIVENILRKNKVNYKKEITYISEQNLFMVIYEMEGFRNE